MKIMILLPLRGVILLSNYSNSAKIHIQQERDKEKRQDNKVHDTEEGKPKTGRRSNRSPLPKPWINMLRTKRGMDNPNKL